MVSDGTQRADSLPLPGGDFRLFVQKLGYQALISLGVLDNPVTGARSRNLEGARAVVADLEMLRDRTRGNLEEDEQAHLDGVIEEVERHLAVVAAESEGEA